MTEAEWLVCTDPHTAWDHLAGTANSRQRRLFSCAICRRVWHLLGERSRRIVEIAEYYADRLVGPTEFVCASRIAWQQELTEFSYEYYAIRAVVASEEEMSEDWEQSIGTEDLYMTDEDHPEFLKRLFLLCEIIGTPSRPSTIEISVLEWNSLTIPRIARSIYDERAFDRMPILADALEEAGCTNADILNHCRQPGEHVRGCWVIDLLLGKE